MKIRFSEEEYTPGLCYQTNGRLFMKDLAEQIGEEDARLVHGSIEPSVGPMTDKRHDHCWIEIISTNKVLDFSQPGGTLVMDKDQYYATGRVVVDNKYTLEEVLITGLQSQHWGPWE